MSKPSLTPAIATFVFALAAVADDRPNIVFVFSDDHAAHALSAYREHLAYGAPLPPTPGLDRLASEGMLFVNAFLTNSICAPSRATVLTGQYGHLNGVMTNAEEFHPTRVTFPALLRESGYRTALFGKWHLKADPGRQLFDHYEILRGQGPYYNPTLRSADDSTAWEGYTPDIVTERAMAWIDRVTGGGTPSARDGADTDGSADGAAGERAGAAVDGPPEGAPSPFLADLPPELLRRRKGRAPRPRPVVTSEQLSLL